MPDAFDAAKAILIQQHGAVNVSADAPGIRQTLDDLLLNSVDPDPNRNELIKTAGMGEEALTLLNKPTYELGVDAEQTTLTGPWFNRHPGEVLVYDALNLYAAAADIRHKFPTGNGCSWSVKSNKQGRRAGDLPTNKITLKLLFKPALLAQIVTPAALA